MINALYKVADPETKHVYYFRNLNDAISVATSKGIRYVHKEGETDPVCVILPQKAQEKLVEILNDESV